MKFLFSLAIPLYLLDQATKWTVIHYDREGLLPHEVIPNFFQLVHWQNTGAAFSMGDGKNWFFAALSIVALVGILIAWHRRVFTDAPSRWGIGFLVGGILGNLTDRLVHGHVVDFLLFDLHVRFAHPWPAFNVADSAIFCAVALLMIASFRAEKKASEIKKGT